MTPSARQKFCGVRPTPRPQEFMPKHTAKIRHFYEFLRSLQAYENIIQDTSTVVLPSDSELLNVLKHPGRVAPAIPSEKPLTLKSEQD